MTENERKSLEEELELLKVILNFHSEFEQKTAMTPNERVQHIDDILDRILEIKEFLKKEQS